MSTTKWIALVLALVLSGPAMALVPREGHTDGVRYLVFETAGAEVGDRLPMIVGLHYSSSKPEEMAAYFETLDFPARIVLPQGPLPKRSGYTWFTDDKGAPAAADAMSRFIAAITKRHATQGKPIVTGISYGGDLAFLLALRHPTQFRAAFPIAGRLLPKWKATCTSQCPLIRAMHGDKDTTVPMGPTQLAVAKLKKAGIDATLVVYPGVAHDFDAAEQRDFALQAKRLFEADQPSLP